MEDKQRVERITISLFAGQRDWLRLVARQRMVSASAVVRQLIADAQRTQQKQQQDDNDNVR
jgi:hypothetical protein